MDTLDLKVIVPVFNTPMHDLERCLKSIQLQTYDNWSCLIVDASLNVETSKFVKNFCRSNDKFDFVKITNRGASGNRNEALKLCKAEFVTFVDADDEIVPTFFEKSLKFIASDDSIDVVVGVTSEIKNHNEEYPSLNLQNPIFISSTIEKNKLLSYLVAGVADDDTSCLSGILVGRVYPKIIRTKLAQQVEFNDKIIIHEDNIFSFKIFELARKIVITPDVFYQYYKNNYSITNSMGNLQFNDKRLKNEIEFSKDLLNLVNSSKYEIKKSAIGIRLVNNIMNYIYSIDGNVNEAISLLLKSNILNKIPKADYRDYPDVGIKKKLILRNSHLFRSFMVRAMIIIHVIRKNYFIK